MELSPLEIFGVIFGVAGVYLTVRENVWCWPVLLIDIILYMIIFYRAGIIANTALQGFFFIISVYGWYHWIHGGKDDTELKVSRISVRLSVVLILIAIAAGLALAQILKARLESEVPYLDASTTVVSIIAQWMMARKYLESWIVWIAVDAVYVGFFIYIGLFLTAGLYTVFLALALSGFIAWEKSWKKQTAPSA